MNNGRFFVDDSGEAQKGKESFFPCDIHPGRGTDFEFEQFVSSRIQTVLQIDQAEMDNWKTNANGVDFNMSFTAGVGFNKTHIPVSSVTCKTEAGAKKIIQMAIEEKWSIKYNLDVVAASGFYTDTWKNLPKKYSERMKVQKRQQTEQRDKREGPLRKPAWGSGPGLAGSPSDSVTESRLFAHGAALSSGKHGSGRVCCGAHGPSHDPGSSNCGTRLFL